MIVYTANYGNHDVLKRQPKQTIDCRFVCFTDNPDVPQEDWANREIVVDVTYNHLHPRLESKRYRTHPFSIFPEEDVIMYMDSNARLGREDSVECLVELLENNDILAFKHPDRDCIYDEAKVCKIEKPRFKYLGLPLMEQVEYYRKQGRPKNNGLSATGLLLFKKSNKLKEALNYWFFENLLWTYQDQLSFDYIMATYKIKKWRIFFNLRNNKYIDFKQPHLSLK